MLVRSGYQHNLSRSRGRLALKTIKEGKIDNDLGRTDIDGVHPKSKKALLVNSRASFEAQRSARTGAGHGRIK